MSHRFKAGDLVRFGTYEGILISEPEKYGRRLCFSPKQEGMDLTFRDDGALYPYYGAGCVLILIKAAHEHPVRKTISVSKYPNTGNTVYQEIFPNDIGPFTKAEAREWFNKAWRSVQDQMLPGHKLSLADCMLLMKALGISEDS